MVYKLSLREWNSTFTKHHWDVGMLTSSSEEREKKTNTKHLTGFEVLLRDKHFPLSFLVAHLLRQIRKWSKLTAAHWLHQNYTHLQQLKLTCIKAAFHTKEELPRASWSQELQGVSSSYLIIILNTHLLL